MKATKDILHKAFYKVGIDLRGIDIQLESYSTSSKSTICYSIATKDFDRFCHRYIASTNGTIYGYSMTPSNRYMIAGVSLIKGKTFDWETIGIDYSLWDTKEGQILGRWLEDELRSRLTTKAA